MYAKVFHGGLILHGRVMAYTSCNNLMSHMAENNRARLHACMGSTPHIITIDTVNRQIGPRNATLVNKNFLDNSTSTYIVNLCGLENIDHNFNSKKGMHKIWFRWGKRKDLVVWIWHPEKSQSHCWHTSKTSLRINSITCYKRSPDSCQHMRTWRFLISMSWILSREVLVATVRVWKK